MLEVWCKMDADRWRMQAAEKAGSATRRGLARAPAPRPAISLNLPLPASAHMISSRNSSTKTIAKCHKTRAQIGIVEKRYVRASRACDILFEKMHRRFCIAFSASVGPG